MSRIHYLDLSPIRVMSKNVASLREDAIEYCDDKALSNNPQDVTRYLKCPVGWNVLLVFSVLLRNAECLGTSFQLRRRNAVCSS